MGAVLDRVAADEGGLSPQATAALLKVSMGELAVLTRVHRNTLLRNPGSPLVQARLGEIAQILATATDVFGDKDPDRAVVWFRHRPLTGWEGETAASLVGKGRADAVRWHLELLADGAYA